MQTHRQAQNIHKKTHINNIFQVQTTTNPNNLHKKDQLAHPAM